MVVVIVVGRVVSYYFGIVAPVTLVDQDILVQARPGDGQHRLGLRMHLRRQGGHHGQNLANGQKQGQDQGHYTF